MIDKAMILNNAKLQKQFLAEMAAKELQQVIKMIKSNEIEAAARKYIEIGGNPSGVTKTVNSYLKKNPTIDPAPFQRFRESIIKIKAKEFPAEKKTYKSRGVTGTTKEGEKVISGRTAAAQKKIEKIQFSGLATKYKASEKELETLETGTIEQNRKLAKQIYNDQKGSGDIKYLQAWISRPAKEPTAEVKYGKSITGLNKNKIVGILLNFIKGSREKIKKEIEAKSDEELSFLISKMLESFEKDLEILKTFYETGKNQKEAMALMRSSLKKGKKALETLGGVAMEKERISKMKEGYSLKDVNYYEQMLKESYGYRGDMFWENYILSNLVRTFPEYIIEYGDKSAMEMFMLVYGEETKPLFEYMVESENLLFEASLVAGNGLLFEEIGQKNMERYLTEVDEGIVKYVGKRVPTGINFSGMLRKSRSGLRALTEPKSRILGFLSGLWNKLKDLGRSVFGRVVPFLKARFRWAKELVTKGVGWIATNPIAKVAIPAVLIAGGVLGAVKLINRLRKRAGKKELSNEEHSALEDIADKNKARIETYKRRAQSAA